jgi:uncharacterized protein DUF1399
MMIPLGFDYIRAAKASKGILRGMDEGTIEALAERYHRFLLLKAKHPNQTLAPTEIVDEMWHLHMLHPVAYYDCCMRTLGFILDHKPGFGDTPATRPRLLAHFEATAALWEAEYGQPYCVPGMKFHNVIVCADDEEDEAPKKPKNPVNPVPNPAPKPAPKPATPSVFA